MANELFWPTDFIIEMISNARNSPKMPDNGQEMKKKQCKLIPI